jgi:hypothetical protein
MPEIRETPNEPEFRRARGSSAAPEGVDRRILGSLMRPVMRSRGYALCWTMLFIFMVSALLGLAAAHTAYFSAVTDVYLKRAQARSELFSLTNLALRWLTSELRTGANWRAEAVKSGGHLTNSGALCIFSLEDPSRGSVKVFDLSYDPEKLTAAASPAELLSFPPSCPGAYLVRAAVAKRGLASMTAESVFVLTSNDVPGEGIVGVLEEEPLFSREVFR